MTNFHLHFDPSLASVSTSDGQLTQIQNQPTVKSYDAEAFATLESIATQLSAIQSQVEQRADQLQNHIVDMAVFIAQGVLGAEESLIEKRAQRFVSVALAQLQPQVPRTVFVHPTCVDSIEKWISNGDHESINVSADDAVLPGDCRVESGKQGVAATLDAFLASVTSQLAAPGVSHDS